MKNILKIFAALSVVIFMTACQKDEFQITGSEFVDSEYGVFGDQIKLRLNIATPDPVVVQTKSVDPDGKDLHSLTLFCFDENGIFIDVADGTINGSADGEGIISQGSFDAVIPINTRIFHLLGNQNMARFEAGAFEMKSEDEVLSILEGSSGMLIYWARIEVPSNVNQLYANVPDADKRSEPEAIFDWITIETNPANKAHKGVAGKGNPIIMLRNQAKFTIVSDGWEERAQDKTYDESGNEILLPRDPWKGPLFEVTGFAVCNTPAFGTVAPYHPEKGYPTWQSSAQSNLYGLADWLLDKPITSPLNTDKMSDVNDVITSKDYYVFETDNKSTDPVDLILRGRNIVDGVPEAERYYYRVNILNEDGEYIAINRNHKYEIHVTGNLTNGCRTFEEALSAPPTNNIWLSISDEVKAVMDNEFELAVEKTKVIVSADPDENLGMPAPIVLNFSVKDLNLDDSKPLDHSRLSVRWVEDDQIVSNTYNPSLNVGGNHVMFAIDGNIGHGMISLNMNDLPDGVNTARGTILVKYGHLQRTIRVVLIKTLSFVPSWVSSEVYGSLSGDDSKGENITVIFNIPQDCPSELFPFDVLLTTNGLDGRASSGQILPVVGQLEKGYGEKFSFDVTEVDEDGNESKRTLTHLGYKYRFTVTEPGQKRIYFENIFNVVGGAKEYVVLEAEHFEMIAKPVTFVEHTNRIELPKLKDYSAIPGVSESEVIKYILVPQKRFSPVTFDISLKVPDGTNLGTLSKEEFLLYSSNLDHYPDNDTRYTVPKRQFDCSFVPYSEELWSTGGRIFGFYPRPDASHFWDENCFQIYMETNKPVSSEVVRIASNQVGSKSIKDASALYNGMTFRSVTFELANYRPFRFAAQVKADGFSGFEGDYVGDDATSGTQNPEKVEDLNFTYLPEQIVEVAFDITSFQAQDGSSVHPFGTGFEVFIDAPMLKLENGLNPNIEGRSVAMFDKRENGEQYTENKPKLEDLGNGRFVYRVNADDWEEQSFWNDDKYTALISDDANNISQKGDRKIIRFKTKGIVSSGNLTISANPDHVSYHSKTFRINNNPLQGNIGYIAPGQSEPIMLPAEHFVSFTRIKDGSRIGSLVVKPINDLIPNGPTYYELRLRKEYEFEWENDPIKISSQVDGVVYTFILPDLKTLYEAANKTIILGQDVEPISE